MPDSNNERPIGERLLQDRRSTTELIEAALVEAERPEGLPEGYPAIAVLHARGTRDVLDAALASCGSPDPRRRALGADMLGQLHLFHDAAKTFLDVDEKRKVDPGVLLAALRSRAV